jgi:predicted Fe-S protein YdhL (DUF1289 family)
MTNQIQSLCIGVCTYNDLPHSEKFCRGCGRTVKEITEWGRSSDEQKAIILQNSKERKKSI